MKSYFLLLAFKFLLLTSYFLLVKQGNDLFAQHVFGNRTDNAFDQLPIGGIQRERRMHGQAMHGLSFDALGFDIKIIRAKTKLIGVFLL